MTKQQLIDKINEEVADDDKVFYLKMGYKTECMTNLVTISDDHRTSLPRDTSKYEMVNTLLSNE